MTSANSDIHCQLTSSLVAVTREYIFGTWIFARLLTQADVRVLKSAWIVALEFGCSWDWRRDHCIMHTGRCGQAPFLFIWSCRRKVVETRKSRIRAYPWIVVWSCSCSTPQYSANRSIRKHHQKTSVDRGKISQFFSGTIWAPPSTLPTEASVTNTKKHSQTGGNSRDFFLGLFEHLHVLCLKCLQMGLGGFFPTKLDLADILGRTDLDFEIFFCFVFCWIPKYGKSGRTWA